MNTSSLPPTIDRLLRDPGPFSRHLTGLPLRRYQLEVARAVLGSVLHRRGLTFAVLMSRQAGKNETAAQLEALLLLLFARSGGWLVKASPTFQPQSLNSLLRLEARLDNPCTRGHWRREAGRIVRLGNARALFLSAQPGASVVGATASIVLEADEAQDIPEEKWNKDFRPMGASANVTTVLWGTAWTPDTLLARTVERLRRQEEEDGVRRVFRVPWQQVGAARCELLPGPGRRLRWGVPRGEDDLLISAALCAALEDVGWGAGESFIIRAVDPIEEMDRVGRWRAL